MKKIWTKPAVRWSLCLLCCLLWGSAFPCVKIGYEWFHISETGSQVLFAGYRFFLAGVLTFLFGWAAEKKIPKLSKDAAGPVLVFGFFQTAVQYFFFYVGMANTTGVKGSVINASYAFVSIIAAHFILKEKLNWQKGVGCLVGVAGVILINLSPGAFGEGFAWNGEGMIVICTTVYGLCAVAAKFVAKYADAMTMTAYQLMFGGSLLSVAGFLMGGKIGYVDGKSPALLIYMALLSAVAFTLWTVLLKYNPVGKVTIFGFSIPIFGSVLSAVFMGEKLFSWKNLAALLLVSAGIIMVNKVSKDKGEHDVL